MITIFFPIPWGLKDVYRHLLSRGFMPGCIGTRLSVDHHTQGWVYSDPYPVYLKEDILSQLLQPEPDPCQIANANPNSAPDFPATRATLIPGRKAA